MAVMRETTGRLGAKSVAALSEIRNRWLNRRIIHREKSQMWRKKG
jgi:hypothetical protein